MPRNETRLEQVFLRFSTGAAHQKSPHGEIEGAHMVTAEYVIGDDGEVLGVTQNPLNGMAQPLDPAKVAGVLGEQFAGVAAQLDEAQQQAASATKQLAEVTGQKETLEAACGKLQSSNDEYAKRHAAVVQTLTAPTPDVA